MIESATKEEGRALDEAVAAQSRFDGWRACARALQVKCHGSAEMHRRNKRRIYECVALVQGAITTTLSMTSATSRQTCRIAT